MSIAGTLLISITGWLAIELFNRSVKDSDLINQRLNDISQKVEMANAHFASVEQKIERLETTINMTNDKYRGEIDDLKSDNKTFWNLLISDPMLPRKKKR